MKIIGSREEINYIHNLILKDYTVECAECPAYKQCTECMECNQERCEEVIWNFIEIEEVTE